MQPLHLLPILMLAGACLWGCALQPPPSRSDIQAQSGIVAQIDPARPWQAADISPDPVQDGWLSTFDDPHLEALAEEAQRNNPDLRTAALRVEQARQYAELARSALRPSVNLFGTGGLNMVGGDMSSALQGVLLGVSWEADLWGRLRYGLAAAQEGYVSSLADLEHARQSLAAGVARAWFTAVEAGVRLTMAEQMADTTAELVALAGQRLRVGVAGEREVALARADLANQEDAVASLRLAYDHALRALELLLGRYPGADIQARPDLPALPAALPAGLPLEMLERRPDMIAAERRVAAAFNRVGEARAARLPRISITAGVGVLDSNILKLKEDFQNPVGGAGARLLAPVYQGGALRTQEEIRTIEQREAVAEYAAMALRALGDVENALAAGHALTRRRAALEQAVAEHGLALDLVQAQQRIGRGDRREVLRQRLNLDAARLELLNVRAEELLWRVNLHLALGGGFTSGRPHADSLEQALAGPGE